MSILLRSLSNNFNNFNTDDSSEDDDDEYQLSEQITGEEVNGSIEDDDGDENDETAVMENNMSWRDNLTQKARTAYLERQSNTQNLMKIVYGALNAVG